MAGDLGLHRMGGEDDTRFACRVSYSALRFWMQAFCLDDGYGGAYGVSESAIIRKSAIWLRNLADLYPGILDWYRFYDAAGARGLASILHTLAAMRDLVKTEDGLYRCAAMHTAPAGTYARIRLGLADPTDMDDRPPISGMGFIAKGPARTESAPTPAQATSSSASAKARIRPGGDDGHVIIELNRVPRSSPDWQCFFMLTWPLRDVTDRQRRMARVEYAPLLADLLRFCGFQVQPS
ncbi:hypothetical protein [Bifidobacterium samirii]|nr:hypothetical protein [Bifidobacterium samirii]